MTKINLDTHEFGHRITPDHPFVKTMEHWGERDEACGTCADPMPTPIVGHVVWPEDQEKTNALLADLVEQLRLAKYDLDVMTVSRDAWREWTITFSTELTELEMSTWAKFKRWFRQQWNYDIYDEHLKG